jgi:hypothetical protein
LTFKDAEAILDRLDCHTQGGLQVILDRLDAIAQVIAPGGTGSSKAPEAS